MSAYMEGVMESEHEALVESKAEDVFEKFKEVFPSHYVYLDQQDHKEVTKDQLVGDWMGDSLDQVELVLICETEFNIDIDDNELYESEAKTIGDLCTFVARRMV